MVAGSYPPDICGVGDYTSKLVEVLRSQNATVEVYSADIDWSLLKTRKLAARITAAAPDVIHIQYPTTGYGYTLGPQALSLLLKPCAVTLHEVSQAHLLRRLSLYPFALGAEQLIFTSDYEIDYALKWFPWAVSRSSVIPIGSFISSVVDVSTKDLDDIVYFGLIRPKKGLEEVIRLAYLVNSESLSLKVRIIGSVEPKHRSYLTQLQSSSVGLPVIWELNLPEQQVAGLLARSRVAYMPFPDGASERRSSLLALLSNGVATVSTKAKFTSEMMSETLVIADTPEEALGAIKCLLTDLRWRELLAQKSRDYVRRHEWSHIASQHLDLYREMLQDMQQMRRPL